MICKNYMGLKVFFRENSSDEAVINHGFDNDIFFPAIPDISIRPGMVILDIGAHIGTFSLLSALKFPTSSVFAFEPSYDSYELLRKNVSENRISNIKTINIAVTEKIGWIDLFLDEENWGHSTSSRISDKVVRIESTTLPAFFERNGIKKCDLIKFNCEGAEFDIILSLNASVLRSIGMMLILYHEDLASESEKNLSVLYRFLKKNNFYCRVVNKTKNRGWLIVKNKLFYKRKVQSSADIKIILKELRTTLMIKN